MNDVQKKIMDECVKQFIENDFRDVTMDSIAKQLGVSKKTVYENFTSKEDLFVKSLKAYTEKTAGIVEKQSTVVQIHICNYCGLCSLCFSR